MSEQPEALRLADVMDSVDEEEVYGESSFAATELRRLHALCEEMGEALDRIAALDYANAAINCCALTAVEISQAALAKWEESK